VSESKLSTFNFISNKAQQNFELFQKAKQIQIKLNFKIKTCLITKFSSEERKCDALPRYNNIAMLFHQDKTEDELANSEENIKDGGMTLDDDFSPFSGRAKLSSYHTTCLHNQQFSFIT